MRSTRRTIRELGVVGLVLALVLGIVVAAVQAEGERTIRPDTNDGGAWLINGSEGAVGHVNRSSQEITGAVRIAEPGDRIDAEQSGQLVAVVNRSQRTVQIIDARTFQAISTTTTPPELSIRLAGDTATLWTESPLRVWRMSISDLGELTALDESTPLVSEERDGFVAVTRFGGVLAVDSTGEYLHRLNQNESIPQRTSLGDMGSGVVGLTAHGDDAVFVTVTGSVFVARSGSEELGEPFSFGNTEAIGQPSLPDEPLTAVTTDGTVLAIDIDSDAPLPRTVGSVSGSSPLPPLFHRGCVFVVTRSPAELTRICGDTAEPPVALTGAGAELRLRLINGWVWVNDLKAGALWVIDDTTPLDRIDDWGAALANDDNEEGDESDESDDGSIEQRENPDADEANIIRADEIDEDGVNERPVAVDDFATTRVDVPVVVQVLRNDTDPDGDVLLVRSIDDVPSQALADITATRQGVQFVPPIGRSGEFSFEYTISDGRGGTDSATVTVDVVDPLTRLNQAPIAVTDIATARAGSSAALNVLDNDRDPDGDSIVLVDVEADAGTVKFDATGQVTFIPDPGSSEGTEELRYTIADTFGATASGTIRVAIRLRGANNAPDARNDSAVIPAGSPLSMNVLLNDTDPDGNAISVGAEPVRVSPAETEAELQLSADGQLFFTATEPGQYLYRYTITDAEKQDEAFIRIVVTEVVANRPPIAIRDDVTVPRGGAATVFVLANDYDPDGDVIAIDTWGESEFLTIESFRGVGFVVRASAESPEQLSFRYTITDGLNEPAFGVVVVAVAETGGANQPPIATPDVLEVRPGTTAVAPVLANDFDPEGAPLRIVNVSAVSDAELRISADGQDILVSLPEDAISGFTFAYDIVDDADNLAGTTVDVRIVPEGQTNRPPIARADSARTSEERSVTIPVVNNDSDPDGDIIRLESIAAQPTAGTATIVDGAVVYTPDPGFAGTDNFRYVIADPFDGRAIGDVLVGVIPDTAENRPPSARDDQYTVVAGSDTVLLDVTGNDYDPDGDDLVIIRTSGGDALETASNAKGLLFTPAIAIDRESVEVTATYTIDDGRGATSQARVTIEVIQSRQLEAPIPIDDVAGPVRPGDTIEVVVTANDLDPDGKREQLAVSIDDSTVAVGSVPGSLVFTAGNTTSTHRYTVTDVDGQTASAVVTIIVYDNVAPIVNPINRETPYETPISVSLATAVSDIDDDDLFFVCCSENRGGSTDITTTAAGVLDVVFTPDDGFSGLAGFSYSVDDQNGHVVSGSVAIVVEPKENGAPTATDSELTVEAGTSSSVSLSALADDEDLPTGDVLSYSIETDGLNDAILAGDTVTVTTSIDEGNTSGWITYTVTDRDGLSATGRVEVAVSESSVSPPIAVADQVETNQTVPVEISVFDNDVDPLGQGLRLLSVGSTSSIGTITWSETTGVVTFSPAVDFFGTAQLTYTIEDARRLPSGQSTAAIQVDVTGFPDAPPTPEAIADNGTATVTWEQPNSNGGRIDQFEVESDTNLQKELGATSGATFDLLTNGEPIRFKVRAHNAAGWGDWSNWSDPVTPDTQPGRPGAPTVEFRDGSLRVSWTTPPNEGTIISNYVLEIGGGISESITLFNTLEYTWPGLTNGVEYQFKVTAVNDAGPSDESPWSSSEHPLRQPDAPTAPAVTRGDGFLDLAWGIAPRNGDDIARYEVQMRSAQATIVPIPSGRNHSWANLTNGIAQEFRVRAINRDPDPGAWSSWSTPIQPCGVPLPNPAPAAVRGDTLASLSWELPARNGCALTGIRVESVDGSVSKSLPATATSTSMGGLVNGTSYQFVVRGTNVVGDGTFGAPSNAVTPAGPPCAPNLYDLFNSGLGTVRYGVLYGCTNGAPFTLQQIRFNGGSAENPTIEGILPDSYNGIRSALAPNTSYSLQARSCNEIGCGPWGNTRSLITDGPPSTPSNFVGSDGTTLARWSWNSVTSNGSGLRYESVLNISGQSPIYTNHGLSRNVAHSWAPYVPLGVQVRACNDLGCSGWSAQRNAQIRPAFSWSIAQNGSWVRGTGAGLGANVTYTTQCFWENIAGDAWVPGFTGTVTSNSSGELVNNLCTFSIQGRRILAHLRPVGASSSFESNILTWQ